MTTSLRHELVELLEAYVPTPGEERALSMMLAAVGEVVDVLSASTYAPGHFTVSAFITDFAVTRLALVHHGRVGAWLQPGGHIEPEDESVQAALAREIEEEVGLTELRHATTGLFDVDVHSVPAHGVHPAHRHFDLRFHLVTSQAELVPDPSGDEARWVPLGDLDVWTADGSVRRAADKLRGPGSSAGRR